MSDAKRIDATLPEDGLVSPWLDAHQRTTSEQNGLLGGLFRRTVEKWGKLAAYAEMVQRPAQHMSQLFSGARAIYLRDLLPVMGQREAVLAFVQPFLDSIGYAAMPRPKMSKRQAGERVTNAVRKVTALWPVVREMAAKEAGVEPEQIDLALDGFGEITKTGG